MTLSRTRRALLTCAVLATTALASLAHAQQPCCA
jgi:phosphonate transport system substrate-binding protein